MTKPKLYITVGISGSGKTTFCKTLLQQIEGIVYVSLDNIKQNYPNQSAAPLAFKEISESLKSGRVVIFDANNCVAQHRKNLLQAIDLELDAYQRYAIVFPVFLVKSLRLRFVKLGFNTIIKQYLNYVRDTGKLESEPFQILPLSDLSGRLK